MTCRDGSPGYHPPRGVRLAGQQRGRGMVPDRNVRPAVADVIEVTRAKFVDERRRLRASFQVDGAVARDHRREDAEVLGDGGGQRRVGRGRENDSTPPAVLVANQGHNLISIGERGNVKRRGACELLLQMGAAPDQPERLLQLIMFGSTYALITVGAREFRRPTDLSQRAQLGA